MGSVGNAGAATTEIEHLSAGIRSRYLPGINGLTMHCLEAGFETAGRPTVLLLHGFPELAYSWRKVMPPLASAGYHVIAPDQRGYGRTTGWDADYDGDLASYRMLSLVRDTLRLVAALGLRSVDLVGHDFGSPLAALCALIRPDVFRSVALMSAPFGGIPNPSNLPLGASNIHADLAALARPRKHYQWYYATREADANMRHCLQGIHAFLRAYYHHKSADWKANQPYPLSAWSATELAKLPTYYVMDAALGMAETVAAEMPTPEVIESCQWLTERELAVYSREFARTGFQGGLQWYRCAIDPKVGAELQLFAGRTIDVPACFIGGASDWGVYQKPGDFERMPGACTQFRGATLIEGAGHWVQQEQPARVSERLIAFLAEVDRR
jgi:pimeloyl-ACP methyl ester carboxylesterase